MTCKRVPLAKLVKHVHKIFYAPTKQKVTIRFDLDEIKILIHALLTCPHPGDTKAVVELLDRLVGAVRKYEKGK